MKTFRLLPLLLAFALTLLLSACNYAKSNAQVLYTGDCGVTWRAIPTGTRVPSTVTFCEYTTSLPDYPMQGGAEFLTQFEGNVLVKVQIGYDYQITDPLKFIQNAKFLGKIRDKSGDSSEDVQASGSTGTSQYETAENVVIDIRLRELVTNGTKAADIVKFNPSTFEDELFKKANEVLGERGVTLNSITFVTMPEDQTRMAIDSATAMAVYESKGMGELGRDLVKARAGATQVNVHAK